jgi:hypothetical protein
MCKDQLGLNIGKPIVPAMLFSFCDLSREEFVIIDDDENMSEQTTEFKQMSMFLEGCRVSNDWCKKFSLVSSLELIYTLFKQFLLIVYDSFLQGSEQVTSYYKAIFT